MVVGGGRLQHLVMRQVSVVTPLSWEVLQKGDQLIVF